MATVSERARELAAMVLQPEIRRSTRISPGYKRSLAKLIEQALLAERRLAMEEAGAIVTRFYDSEFAARNKSSDLQHYAHEHAGAVLTRLEKALRAAAETELDGPRGGE